MTTGSLSSGMAMFVGYRTGTTSDNVVIFGAIGDSPYYNGISCYDGSSWTVQQNTVQMPTFTEVDVTFKYDGGVMTYSALGETVTLNKIFTNRSYLKLWPGGNGSIKNITVYEL